MLLITEPAQFVFPAVKLIFPLGQRWGLRLFRRSEVVELSDMKDLCSVVAESDISHLKCTAAVQSTQKKLDYENTDDKMQSASLKMKVKLQCWVIIK